MKDSDCGSNHSINKAPEDTKLAFFTAHVVTSKQAQACRCKYSLTESSDSFPSIGIGKVHLEPQVSSLPSYLLLSALKVVSRRFLSSSRRGLICQTNRHGPVRSKPS